MTLVLNCATQECVFQVSDRRFTNLLTGKPTEEERTKAIVFCGRLAFSYTGLAKIDGELTDKWLTKLLAESSSESGSQAIDVIRAKATEAFRRIRVRKPAWKCTAFAGVGWALLRKDQSWQPFVCHISNFHADGKRLELRLDEFQSTVHILPSQELFVCLPIGQDLLPAEEAELTAKLHRSIGQRATPSDVLRSLVECVRRVASRNSTVGDNLLTVMFPRSAAGSGSIFAGPPSPNAITCMYLAAGQATGRFYGPNMVCHGTGITDFGGGTIHHGQSTFRSKP